MKIVPTATHDYSQIERLMRRLHSIEEHEVQYGYFAGDIHEDSGLDIAELAAYLNEDRPFMQYAEELTQRHFEITSQWKRDVWDYLKGTGNITTLLRQFGRIGEINVQASIDNGEWLENIDWWREAKIAKYGVQASVPLIASGELYESVDSRVFNTKDRETA